MNTTSTDIHELPADTWPLGLAHIPQPPKSMWIQGTLPDIHTTTWLTIVGSRKATAYGKHVCDTLIPQLAGLPIVIVSGLALGIDGYAHTVAVKHRIRCVAIPGSGLNASVLAPAQHLALAQQILQNDGCLLSPFAPLHPATPYTFPTRNRIMVGVSQAVLIIEATEKSGTLITARMAIDYNRDVGIVPGHITHPGSYGPHKLLDSGATPIYDAVSLRHFLGFDDETHTTSLHTTTHAHTPEENKILSALTEPCTTTMLHERTGLPIDILTATLTALVLQGLIAQQGAYITRIL